MPTPTVLDVVRPQRQSGGRGHAEAMTHAHAFKVCELALKAQAALAAECLSTGKELLVTPEQALHVLEIITAARESSATGRRVKLTSTFKWPIVN
mgnify:CR=1 FL=1